LLSVIGVQRRSPSWRLRPLSRVGRPVTEVLAVVDAARDAAIVERHGEDLTYAGTAGHELTRDGRFIPAGDADVVAGCARRCVAPLLVLLATGPPGAAAVRRAVPSVVEHVVARGHRGVLLDTGEGPDVEPLITRMTDALHADGLWSGIVVRKAALPRCAASLDLVVIDLPAGPSRAERVATFQAHAGLLHVSASADDLGLGLSLVRDLGLRGVAVPAASIPAATDVISHRCQIRRRAR
jgi:hypothetical protein